MKKLKMVLITAVAIWGLQGCGGSTKTDSKAAADSVNGKKDSTTTSAGITVDKDDAKFATEAASGGMMEVEAGKIAQQKATNAKVKDFGAMMVTDHTKANNELMALAKSKNITLPAVPGADDQKKLDDLTKKTGADFDKAYASAMVDDHKADISKFEDAAKNGKDPDLKAFAIKTLPTLKMHLSAAKTADSLLKK